MKSHIDAKAESATSDKEQGHKESRMDDSRVGNGITYGNREEKKNDSNRRSSDCHRERSATMVPAFGPQ